MTKPKILFAFLLLIRCVSVVAQRESLDTVVVNRIKREGLSHSKVMDIAFHLTDVNGPRLTNSAGYKRAADYAVNMLAQWGLTKVALVPFDEFGKGWELEHFYMAMTTPYYRPLVALPRAWTRGTNGLKSADVLLVQAKEIADLTKLKGTLSGKILILDHDQSLPQAFPTVAGRLSDTELNKLAEEKPAERSTSTNGSINRFIRTQNIPPQTPKTFASELRKLAMEEEAVAVLNFSRNGKEGAIAVGGLSGYRPGEAEQIPDIMMTLEDYMTTLRLVKANVPIKIDLEVRTKFSTQDLQGYNVIADIPGTDPEVKDEVVMVGGHLDSWHGSTGATDNAAGVAVIMEAIRILKQLSIQPRRTIRIALWGGEEQGLLGSRGYVRNTFFNSKDGSVNASYEKFSVYYNLDNGGGKIRGIYLGGNEAARSIFSRWFEPFGRMGVRTITSKATGGTDHSTFVGIGLPGFQFIQDPLNYYSKTHHTNVDSFDHLIESDLKTSAIVMASILYHSAIRDGRFPRK